MPQPGDYRRLKCRWDTLVVVVVVVGKTTCLRIKTSRRSLRAAPAFSLGDYENFDIIVGAFYVVRSLPDKHPIPLDQPSKTPPGFHIRIGHCRGRKEEKAGASPKPVNGEVVVQWRTQMIALRFWNTKWQIVENGERYIYRQGSGTCVTRMKWDICNVRRCKAFETHTTET